MKLDRSALPLVKQRSALRTAKCPFPTSATGFFLGSLIAVVRVVWQIDEWKVCVRKMIDQVDDAVEGRKKERSSIENGKNANIENNSCR